MENLVRTNNIALISFVESLLKELGVVYFIADQNISAAEGSVGLFPKRILVEAGRWAEARATLIEVGLNDELEIFKS